MGSVGKDRGRVLQNQLYGDGQLLEMTEGPETVIPNRSDRRVIPTEMTIRDQFPDLLSCIIGPILLGPTVPDLILTGFR